MHKRVAFAFGLLSVAAIAPAYAGYKGNTGVYLDVANRQGVASLADTRDDGTPSNWVSIKVERSASIYSGSVTFKVGQATGGCFTSDAASVQILASAPSDAVVSVQWDANGQCTSVLVRNSSYNAPKTP